MENDLHAWLLTQSIPALSKSQWMAPLCPIWVRRDPISEQLAKPPALALYVLSTRPLSRDDVPRAHRPRPHSQHIRYQYRWGWTKPLL